MRWRLLHAAKNFDSANFMRCPLYIHSSHATASFAFAFTPWLKSAARCSAICVPYKTAISTCTKSCHTPVDGMHSIENKDLAGAGFSLTKIIESVKQTRSLTVS
jgi:hypothetical protein